MPAPTPAPVAAAGHGWLVVETEDGAMVLHAPPRGEAGEGALRVARRLRLVPDAWTPSGDRVLIAYNDPPRIGAVRVRDSGLEGYWTTQPASGLTPIPPPEGEILSLAAGASGVLATTDAGLQFLEEGGSWQTLQPPPGAGPFVDAGGSRIALLETRAPSASVWELERRGDELVWRSWPIRVDGPVVSGWTVGRGLLLADARGGMTVFEPGGAAEGTRIVEPGSDAPGPGGGAAEAAGLIRGVLPAGAGGGARLLELEWDPADPAEAVLTERSAVSGRELWSGAPVRHPPLGAWRFRALAIGTMLMMSCSLLIVTRPDPEPTPLPEGWTLAPPGARLLASVLDFSLALMAVGALTGAEISLSPLAWFVSWDSALALVGAMSVGAASGTVLERWIGRTPGKALLGLRVLGADGRPVGLGAAAWRNLIKWGLPPVAAMALTDAEGKHKGDRVARAHVVIPRREDGS